jgi:hypothetical protein
MIIFENNITYTLLLAFIFISFSQSGLDKITDWKGNLAWLNGHFEKSVFKNTVPILLGIIVVMEIVTAIVCIWGIYDLLFNQRSLIAFYAAVLSAITLLMLLLGQRVAKDYDGARTIVIYLIPTILLVFFLEMGL